jgi:amidase
LYEFKADMNAYLAALGPNAPVKSLKDLIAYNDAHRDTEMRYFGQDTFIQAQRKGPLTDVAYKKALANNHALSRVMGIDAVMKAHKLDAIVAPTGSPTWPIDLINGDHFTGASSTPAAVAGYPSISLPIGYAYELPVGLSFIGAAWSEAKLIRLAYALEQTMNVRSAPRFLATAPTP